MNTDIFERIGKAAEKMDYELHYKLKHGNVKAFRRLYELELRRLWFICYHITQNAAYAAPLLIQSWKAAIEFLTEKKDPPRDNFNTFVSNEIFKRVKGNLEEDEQYSKCGNQQC